MATRSSYFGCWAKNQLMKQKWQKKIWAFEPTILRNCDRIFHNFQVSHVPSKWSIDDDPINYICSYIKSKSATAKPKKPNNVNCTIF